MKKTTSLMILSLFFSGCAVMNSSILETADTVKPGHFKMGIYGGTGIALLTLSQLDETVNMAEDDITFLLPAQGFNMGLGVLPETELNAKYWFSPVGMGEGIQFYVKRSIATNHDPFKLAVLPGLAFTSSGNEDDPLIDISRVTSRGLFFPIVGHWRINKHFLLYGSFRYAYDVLLLTREAGAGSDDRSAIRRFGAISGISMEFRPIYLRFEVGWEQGRNDRGFAGGAPLFNGGIGFEL